MEVIDEARAPEPLGAVHDGELPSSDDASLPALDGSRLHDDGACADEPMQDCTVALAAHRHHFQGSNEGELKSGGAMVGLARSLGMFDGELDSDGEVQVRCLIRCEPSWKML